MDTGSEEEEHGEEAQIETVKLQERASLLKQVLSGYLKHTCVLLVLALLHNTTVQNGN